MSNFFKSIYTQIFGNDEVSNDDSKQKETNFTLIKNDEIDEIPNYVGNDLQYTQSYNGEDYCKSSKGNEYCYTSTADPYAMPIEGEEYLKYSNGTPYVFSTNEFKKDENVLNTSYCVIENGPEYIQYNNGESYIVI